MIHIPRTYTYTQSDADICTHYAYRSAQVFTGWGRNQATLTQSLRIKDTSARSEEAMSLFVNLLVIDVATWHVRYPSPRPISSCKLVEGDRFDTHVLICPWHFNLRRGSSNRSISAAACSCPHWSIGLHDVTRPEADFSYLFPAYRNISIYIQGDRFELAFEFALGHCVTAAWW